MWILRAKKYVLIHQTCTNHINRIIDTRHIRSRHFIINFIEINCFNFLQLNLGFVINFSRLHVASNYLN